MKKKVNLVKQFVFAAIIIAIAFMSIKHSTVNGQVSEIVIKTLDSIRKRKPKEYPLRIFLRVNKFGEEVDSLELLLFKGKLHLAKKMANKLKYKLEKDEYFLFYALLIRPNDVVLIFHTLAFLRTVDDLANGSLEKYYEIAEQAMREAYLHPNFDKFFRNDREIHGFLVYDPINKQFYIDTIVNEAIPNYKKLVVIITNYVKAGEKEKAKEKINNLYKAYEAIIDEITYEYLMYTYQLSYLDPNNKEDQEKRREIIKEILLRKPFTTKELEKTFLNYFSVDEDSKRFFELNLRHLAYANPLIILRRLYEITDVRKHYVISMFHTHISSKLYTLYGGSMRQRKLEKN